MPSSPSPSEPQELRDRHIGHTILATSVDRPSSEYYCCMLAGRAEYVCHTRSPPSVCCVPCTRQSTSACRSLNRPRLDRTPGMSRAWGYL
jgi:hypothetical protein